MPRSSSQQTESQRPRRNNDNLVAHEVRQAPEFEERVVSVDRVSRTVAGGRRIRFRALVVIGNRNGKVGIGTAKANDVQTAIAKAVNQAKKALITVPLVNESIPHQLNFTFGSSRIVLKPAPKGHSIIAGGAVRPVLELAGINNIVSKSIGSSNTLNNATATYLALKSIKKDLATAVEK